MENPTNSLVLLLRDSKNRKILKTVSRLKSMTKMRVTRTKMARLRTRKMMKISLTSQMSKWNPSR